MRSVARLRAVALVACYLGAPGANASTATAPASAADAVARVVTSVGFETTTVRDGVGPPLAVGVWYPTTASAAAQALDGWTQVVAPAGPVAPGRHPLVVVSHGSGGSLAGHYDTALALARAGFVVAALTHPGDNYRDRSQVTDVAARPRALRRLVDHMLREWPRRAALDSARVGAFGFSNGGYTALIAVGGVPDLARFRAHCRAHPSNDDCRILRAGGPRVAQELATRFPRSVWAHDARIRAAVIAAPALGFAFAPDGLRAVRVPVQLWRAADDRVLPAPAYADAVRGALPTPPEYHVVPGAGHFDFLAPCGAAMAARLPDICASAPGFDRVAFHATFNAAVVAFFERALAPS